MEVPKTLKPKPLEDAIVSIRTNLSSFFGNLNQPKPSRKTATFPAWARIASPQAAKPLSSERVEERLAGVAVYALSNSNGEFVLVKSVASGNSLGLLCFKEEDANALLNQLKTVPNQTGTTSRVVPLALNKVFNLKVDGISFRFIPDSNQVKTAIQIMEREGISGRAFTGVPVFQSRSLVLKSEGKSYRPLFFRKEDLEKSIAQASQERDNLNPEDIQVAVFEEVIKCMKEGSNPTWDNAIFIPPGFDVPTPSQ